MQNIVPEENDDPGYLGGGQRRGPGGSVTANAASRSPHMPKMLVSTQFGYWKSFFPKR